MLGDISPFCMLSWMQRNKGSPIIFQKDLMNLIVRPSFPGHLLSGIEAIENKSSRLVMSLPIIFCWSSVSFGHWIFRKNSSRSSSSSFSVCIYTVNRCRSHGYDSGCCLLGFRQFHLVQWCWLYVCSWQGFYKSRRLTSRLVQTSLVLIYSIEEAFAILVVD